MSEEYILKRLAYQAIARIEKAYLARPTGASFNADLTNWEILLVGRNMGPYPQIKRECTIHSLSRSLGSVPLPIPHRL